MLGWLDRLQRRKRGVGLVVAVIYKYIDDQGGYLAALITYYAFVSLFPLLLLLTTGLGVILARPSGPARTCAAQHVEPVSGHRQPIASA
jgi:uncharacterized BrkB/YihY/UPF0761 family membrane protein